MRVYNTIKYNTIQYNTIQYNKIRYNTIQYNTIHYNTIQYNTIQYNTIQYNTIQSTTLNTVSPVNSLFYQITQRGKILPYFVLPLLWPLGAAPGKISEELYRTFKSKCVSEFTGHWSDHYFLQILYNFLW